MIDVATASVEQLHRAYNAGTLGLSEIPERGVWHNMGWRCSPNYPGYRYYGARGITVCKEWEKDFWSWFLHIGRRPSIPGFVISIDRIDNDKGYLPGNVRWASASEQGRNSRRKREDNLKSRLTWVQIEEIRTAYANEEASQSQLAKDYGVSQVMIGNIVRGEHWRVKGYQPIRRGRPPSVLKAEQVLAIRAAYAAGDVTQAQLASEYGVTGTTIGHIVRGEIWKHLPDAQAPLAIAADLVEGHANLQQQMRGLGYD